MNSCPKELEPYDKAHEKRIEEQDYLQYLWWGHYGVSAMSVAIEHCFSKNSRSEFMKEPLLASIHMNTQMTEEEKQREVDKFFAAEKARRINWKRNKNVKEM